MLTFLIGAGFTFYLPAQQASINELVSRAELARAVALGAVAFNVARALGPALAGAIAAWLGSGSALLASALFFVPMIFAVRGWKRPEPRCPACPRRSFRASRAACASRGIRRRCARFIIRNVSFSVCASAFWALLPVIARDQLGLGAGGFGLLSAGFGIGADRRRAVDPAAAATQSLNIVVDVGRDAVDGRDAAHRGDAIHGARAGRRVRRRRGMGDGVREPVGRHAKRRAGLGAGPRGRR